MEKKSVLCQKYDEIRSYDGTHFEFYQRLFLGVFLVLFENFEANFCRNGQQCKKLFFL